MEEIRLGVIGVGGMGTAHARWLFAGKTAGARLTALCDTDPNRREQLKKEFPGLPVYPEAEELFNAGICDAVIIATPHYGHTAIGIRALKRGLHLLSEKPMGVRLSDARALVETAEEQDRTLAVMFNQRTDPLFIKARELTQGGELGELKRIHWTVTNWYRAQCYYDSGAWRATWRGEGGGVLMNQAPHNLDMWQWICGMPLRLRALCPVAKYHRIEVEDEALITGEYENGATAVFHTSTGEFPGTNRLEILGDRGKLVLEEGKLRLWRLATPERQVCFTAKEPFARIPTTYEEMTFPPVTDPHGRVLQNFADHILHGAPLIAPGREALNEVALANAAYLSAWRDGWATLPPDTAAYDGELAARCEESALREGTTAAGHDEYLQRWQVNW